MPDNSAEIAALEAELAAGVKGVTNDGDRVDFDLDAKRRRLKELRATDTSAKLVRPIVRPIGLGGF